MPQFKHLSKRRSIQYFFTLSFNGTKEYVVKKISRQYPTKLSAMQKLPLNGFSGILFQYTVIPSSNIPYVYLEVKFYSTWWGKGKG
jgi:hypothetical protein